LLLMIREALEQIGRGLPEPAKRSARPRRSS
jgi:hypothetical protein